jgi:hypothetical protein
MHQNTTLSTAVSAITLAGVFIASFSRWGWSVYYAVMPNADPLYNLPLAERSVGRFLRLRAAVDGGRANASV